MRTIYCDYRELGMEEDLFIAIASKRECNTADSFHDAVIWSRFRAYHPAPVKSKRRTPPPTLPQPVKLQFNWQWMRQLSGNEQLLDRLHRFSGLDIAESFRWKVHVLPPDYIDLTVIIDSHTNFIWYDWQCSG